MYKNYFCCNLKTNKSKALLLTILFKFFTLTEFHTAFGTNLHNAVIQGNIETVYNLLCAGADLEAIDGLGMTALHVAAEHGNHQVVEFLLLAGANLEAMDLSGETPLHWACGNGNSAVVALLLQQGANPNAVGLPGMTPLLLATINGKDEVVNLLLSYNQQSAKTVQINLDAQDYSGLTVLQYALKKKYFEISEKLISAKAGFSQPTTNGKNILHWAATEIDDQLTWSFLIQTYQQVGLAGLMIDKKDQNGHTPLMTALRKSNKIAVKTLIEAIVKLNLWNRNAGEILHWAVLNVEDQSTFEVLIQKCHEVKLNIHEIDEQGHTPFTLAFANKKEVATRFFLDFEVEISKPIHKGGILHWLVVFTRSKIGLQHFTAEYKRVRKNINEINAEGNTPLMLAILNGNQAAVEVFMELGAGMNLMARDWTSQLEWAVVHSKDKSILQYVIAAESKKVENFNINAFGKDGFTLLGLAVVNTNQAALEALLEAGAKLDIVNTKNQSALQLAADCVKDETFFKFLFERFLKADLLAPGATLDKPKLCLLELVKHLGNITVGCKLMGYSPKSYYHYKSVYEEKGAEALQESSRKKPVFTTTNRADQEKRAKAVIDLAIANPTWSERRLSNELEKQGIQISSRGVAYILKGKDLNDFDKRLEALEAKSAQDDILLIENINEVSAEGNTPLMLAILNENQSDVEVLIESGATINLLAGGWTSRLEWVVVHSKHKGIVQYVIAAESKKVENFNIDAFGKDGFTLLGLAVINTNQAAVEALLESGAKLDIVNTKNQSALQLAADCVKDETFLKFLFERFLKADLLAPGATLDKPKLYLLELVKHLGNVKVSCKLMGYSPKSYQHYKRVYEEEGEEALQESSRKKPIFTTTNRADQEKRAKAVIDLAIANPTWSAQCLSDKLKKQGILISRQGVGYILKGNDLDDSNKRLKALKSKSDQDGILLTENP